VAALLDLADDLVTVHRGLGEQGEHRRADIAATHARRTAADTLLERRAELVHRLPELTSGLHRTESARTAESCTHERITHDDLLA